MQPPKPKATLPAELNHIASLPPEARHAFTQLALWQAKARPKQLIPISTDGEWREFLLRAGRGWGKTEATIGYAAQLLAFPPPDEPQFRIGLLTKRIQDADLTLTRPGGLLSFFLPGCFIWNKSRHAVKFWNGSSLQCFSAEAPQTIRGDEVNRMIFDEPSSFRYPEILHLADFMTRRGKAAKLYSTTLKRNETTRELMRRVPPECQIAGSTAENLALPPDYLASLQAQWEGTTLGRQELHGDYIADVPGAIFSSEHIEKARTTRDQALASLAEGGHAFAVGIDPQGAHRKQRADKDDTASLMESEGMTGIVVASLSPDGYFYIWHDASISGKPHEWAAAAAQAAAQFGGGTHATELVPEINFGGDMVTEVLHRAAPHYAISPVRATDSKTARAEPISLLYERGRVRHVGILAELEDEMTGFTPASRESPNRMDALVWALTKLDRRPPEIY